MKHLTTSVLTLVLLGTSVSLPAVQADDRQQSWTLQHVEPTEVRRMLKELLGKEAGHVRIVANDRNRRLTVEGPDATRRLAAQLISGIDRPTAPVEADSDAPPILKSYTVPEDELVGRRLELQQALGQDARVSADHRTGQILVMAAPQAQKLAEKLLRLQHTAASELFDPAPDKQASQQPVTVQSASTLFPQGTIRTVAADGQVTMVHRFERITVDQCRKALGRLLKQNVKTRSDGRVEFRSPDTGSAVLTFHSQDQSCELTGDREAVDQFAMLIRWFERSQTPSRAGAIRFVPLRNVRPDVLNKAIRLWRESAGRRTKSENGQSNHNGANPLHQVSFTQDAPADPQQPPAEADAEAADDENEGDLRPPLSGVSVQPFPGLDVLAIQGKDADVAELIRIIREIERLSDETAPEVEIYFLKHVHGGTLERFIDNIVDSLTRPLQGRVSISPISKPNALLLIGWGEAVEAAKKLIEQLDQPVSPDRDMKIFSLKHASVNEVLAPLRQALQRNGALTPTASLTPNSRANSLIVYASPRDMQEIARLIEHLDGGMPEAVSKGRMIRLKNSLAANVAQTINSAIAAASGGGGRKASELEMLLVQPNGEEIVASGVLEDVSLTTDIRTNTIFVTGPEGSLSLVERLIEQLDQTPAASAVIKVFEIANGNASELVTVLRSLFPATAAGSGVPALATAEGESSLVPVRFSVDVRTNTIIATGSTGDLQVMEALLVRLDEVDSQERINRVYRLKNTPATDVARAVNDFLRSERIVNQAAPGRQNPFEQIQQEVVVVPEPVRNSLIVSATPRYFEQIMELVEGLDDQPPQVMIQVILAEVDLNNFHEVGVELGLQDSLLFDRSLLGDLVQTTVSNSVSTPAGVVTTTQENIVAASNTPGFDFNNNPLGNSGSNRSLATAGSVAGQGLSHFNLGRTNADLNYGGLVLSASSESVSLLLRALDQSGSMEVLSRPQIMTLDNQQAFIQVGQRVPRIASSQVTQFGQINSIEVEDVGLLLGVTPRINPDGNVVMEVDAEKSEVGPESQGIPVSVSTDGVVVRSPRVNVTTAQTTVSAASGQTIIIGGLITNANETTNRKVPWLGDLPLLGKLFRYDSHSNRRSELLIILTPHVVLGRSEAEYLKQVEMSRMSWVSSDVFDWIGSGSADYVVTDDNGTPITQPAPDPIGGGAAVPDVPPEGQMTPLRIDSSDASPISPIPTTSTDDPQQKKVQQVTHRIPGPSPVRRATAETTEKQAPRLGLRGLFQRGSSSQK